MPDAAVLDDEFDVESADLSVSASPASEKPVPQPQKPEPPPSEPKPAATARPGHPAFLVEMGREYGLSDRAMSVMGSDELGEFVREQRRRESALNSAVHAHRPESAPRAPEPPPEPDELAELGIDKDKWEPEIVSAFEKLAKNNRSLQKRLEGHEAERRKQTAATAFDALDNFFAGLPEPDRARFGDGDRFTLDAQSSEVKRRLALVRAAGIDLQNPPPPRQIDRMLKAAHADLYAAGEAPAAAKAKDAGAYGDSGNGDGHAAAEPKAVRPKRADGTFMSDAEIAEREREDRARSRWVEGGLERPSERNGSPPPKGRDSANRVVKERLTKLGLPTDSATLSRDDAEAEDTLLD